MTRMFTKRRVLLTLPAGLLVFLMLTATEFHCRREWLPIGVVAYQQSQIVYLGPCYARWGGSVSRPHSLLFGAAVFGNGVGIYLGSWSKFWQF